MQKHRRTHRFLRNLVLGLAVLVVAVPVAQARVDGSSGWSGPRQSEKATGVLDAPSPAALEALRSNTLGISQPKSTADDVLRSNWLGISQPKVVPESSPAPTQVVSRPDGFDWGDAGIGAGTVFAVILLAAGGMLAGRRVRHQATA